MFECGVELKERAVAVQQSLDELSHEQREVVVLKIWGCLTFEEIGDALDISPNTASSRFRYARTKLKNFLMEYADAQ